eukprot:TRINITY_DN44008_c0_g1_i1.p1 TRINITY_DN44008_c0_g1~~TRINITY_DN44008_c0_g1_i1.p1  ORF type:complete len:1791 (+),score=163.96 TRINITY_DN44008_c0_g1_i1:182-5554(+)
MPNSGSCSTPMAYERICTIAHSVELSLATLDLAVSQLAHVHKRTPFSLLVSAWERLLSVMVLASTDPVVAAVVRMEHEEHRRPGAPVRTDDARLSPTDRVVRLLQTFVSTVSNPTAYESALAMVDVPSEPTDDLEHHKEALAGPTNRLAVSLLKFLLPFTGISTGTVRLRACNTIAALVAAFADHDESDAVLAILDAVEDAMLHRLHDRLPAVRSEAVLAVRRLQEGSSSCRVTMHLVLMAAVEPKVPVRRTLAFCLNFNAVTARRACVRLAEDSDRRVRAITWRRLAFARRSLLALPRPLLVGLVGRALRDPESKVREAAAAAVVKWLEFFDGDALRLFKTFDVTLREVRDTTTHDSEFDEKLCDDETVRNEMPNGTSADSERVAVEVAAAVLAQWVKDAGAGRRGSLVYVRAGETVCAEQALLQLALAVAARDRGYVDATDAMLADPRPFLATAVCAATGRSLSADCDPSLATPDHTDRMSANCENLSAGDREYVARHLMRLATFADIGAEAVCRTATVAAHSVLTTFLPHRPSALVAEAVGVLRHVQACRTDLILDARRGFASPVGTLLDALCLLLRPDVYSSETKDEQEDSDAAHYVHASVDAATDRSAAADLEDRVIAMMSALSVDAHAPVPRPFGKPSPASNLLFIGKEAMDSPCEHAARAAIRTFHRTAGDPCDEDLRRLMQTAAVRDARTSAKARRVRAGCWLRACACVAEWFRMNVSLPSGDTALHIFLYPLGGSYVASFLRAPDASVLAAAISTDPLATVHHGDDRVFSRAVAAYGTEYEVAGKSSSLVANADAEATAVWCAAIRCGVTLALVAARHVAPLLERVLRWLVAPGTPLAVRRACLHAAFDLLTGYHATVLGRRAARAAVRVLSQFLNPMPTSPADVTAAISARDAAIASPDSAGVASVLDPPRLSGLASPAPVRALHVRAEVLSPLPDTGAAAQGVADTRPETCDRPVSAATPKRHEDDVGDHSTWFSAVVAAPAVVVADPGDSLCQVAVAGFNRLLASGRMIDKSFGGDLRETAPPAEPQPSLMPVAARSVLGLPPLLPVLNGLALRTSGSAKAQLNLAGGSSGVDLRVRVLAALLLRMTAAGGAKLDGEAAHLADASTSAQQPVQKDACASPAGRRWLVTFLRPFAAASGGRQRLVLLAGALAARHLISGPRSFPIGLLPGEDARLSAASPSVRQDRRVSGVRELSVLLEAVVSVTRASSLAVYRQLAAAQTTSALCVEPIGVVRKRAARVLVERGSHEETLLWLLADALLDGPHSPSGRAAIAAACRLEIHRWPFALAVFKRAVGAAKRRGNARPSARQAAVRRQTTPSECSVKSQGSSSDSSSDGSSDSPSAEQPSAANRTSRAAAAASRKSFAARPTKPSGPLCNMSPDVRQLLAACKQRVFITDIATGLAALVLGAAVLRSAADTRAGSCSSAAVKEAERMRGALADRLRRYMELLPLAAVAASVGGPAGALFGLPTSVSSANSGGSSVSSLGIDLEPSSAALAAAGLAAENFAWHALAFAVMDRKAVSVSADHPSLAGSILPERPSAEVVTASVCAVHPQIAGVVSSLSNDAFDINGKRRRTARGGCKRACLNVVEDDTSSSCSEADGRGAVAADSTDDSAVSSRSSVVSSSPHAPAAKRSRGGAAVRGGRGARAGRGAGAGRGTPGGRTVQPDTSRSALRTTRAPRATNQRNDRPSTSTDAPQASTSKFSRPPPAQTTRVSRGSTTRDHVAPRPAPKPATRSPNNVMDISSGGSTLLSSGSSDAGDGDSEDTSLLSSSNGSSSD